MSDSKFVMTEELKQKMAGLLPLGESSYEYKLKEFDEYPVEVQPIFFLKQYTQGQIIEIKQGMIRETTEKKHTPKDVAGRNELYMKILLSALSKWENMRDLSGNLIVYDGKYETLMKIPEWILNDVFAQSIKLAGFLPAGTM